MDSLMGILILLGGTAIGGVVAWLIVRSRLGAERAVLNERLGERQREADELSGLRGEQEREINDLKERLMALTGELRAHEAQAQRVPLLEEELRAAGSEMRSKGERIASLDTELEKERKATEEKQALLNEAQAKLSDAFKALASDALRLNNESFIELAKQTMAKGQEVARGDLEKRQIAIEGLVKPLRDQLGRYEEQIQKMETLRQKAYGELLNQVTSLDQTQKLLEKETGNLVKALRAPAVRGRWGEITLRRAAELAGMVEYCDFTEQSSTSTEDGMLRPDMIVRLPGGRQIVVDAKTPLSAYLDALEAPDETSRRAAMVHHAQQVFRHMEQLSAKSYWSHFDPTPDFVVLFIPGESFLGAAVEQRPDLMERGFEKRVILATPATFISLLRTVAMGWRQEQLAKNAEQISELGRELYERLSTMGDNMRKLGSSLQSSVSSYNKTVGTLESRVLVTARKFPELGIHSAKELPLVAPVETIPRVLSAPEVLPAAIEDDSGNGDGQGNAD